MVVALQEEISAITGDDAAMAVLGVGADFKEFKELFAPPTRRAASDVIAPLDELDAGRASRAGARGPPVAPGKTRWERCGPVQGRVRALPATEPARRGGEPAEEWSRE